MAPTLNWAIEAELHVWNEGDSPVISTSAKPVGTTVTTSLSRVAYILLSLVVYDVMVRFLVSISCVHHVFIPSSAAMFLFQLQSQFYFYSRFLYTFEIDRGRRRGVIENVLSGTGVLSGGFRPGIDRRVNPSAS